MRRQIDIVIVKALLTKTGNKCAFDECNHPIFDDNNLYVANLCHIEAASPNGPRYNADSSQDFRKSYDNLLFLCYRHHKQIDSDPINYSSDKLWQMKSKHESKFQESYHVSNLQLDQIIQESNNYWSYFDNEFKLDHDIPELMFAIDSKADFLQLYNSFHESLDTLESLLGCIDKEIQTKYFEIFYLGLPNHLMQIHLLIDQMRMKYFEEIIIRKPTDTKLKSKLSDLRKDFKELAKIASRED